MKKIFSAITILFLATFFCLSTTSCATKTIPGKSAYEIACDNGFVGTEKEWLKSLVGDNGKDGQNSEINIYDLYDAYLELYPYATFLDFLEQFLAVQYYQTEYAVAQGIQSIVSIYSLFTRRNQQSGQPSEYASAGSGVIYKIDGGYAYIITNYHVLHDIDSSATNRIAHTIEVYSYGYEYASNGVSSEFIGGSISNDIAVIKAPVANFSSYIKAAQLADSNEVTLGEPVIAIGNPLAEGISVTTGVVSVDSEVIEMEALDSSSSTISLRVIRTDTAINSGNSGGGLFNAKGELLGIVNAKSTETDIENVGFAIPINVAVGIANNVINNNSKKCLLGITVAANTSATQYNSIKNKIEIIEKLTIESISNSLLGGKLLSDDNLLSIKINNGETFSLTRIFHLSDYLYKVRSGDIIYLEIERNNEVLIIDLNITDGYFQSF